MGCVNMYFNDTYYALIFKKINSQHKLNIVQIFIQKLNLFIYNNFNMSLREHVIIFQYID